ncbi:MAG: hypothetical protein QXV81_02140 [Ignisphaera sp.]
MHPSTQSWKLIKKSSLQDKKTSLLDEEEEHAFATHVSRLYIIEFSWHVDGNILYTLLCKAIRAALMLSYGIRRDVHRCFSINNLKTSLLCRGDSVKGLHVDEPSCIGFLKKLFAKRIGIGFEFIDSCLQYAYSLGLQQLNLPLHRNINELENSIGDCGKGFYIKVASDGYGNTEIGLKLWNFLPITNIVLDNICYIDDRS